MRSLLKGSQFYLLHLYQYHLEDALKNKSKTFLSVKKCPINSSIQVRAEGSLWLGDQERWGK